MSEDFRTSLQRLLEDAHAKLPPMEPDWVVPVETALKVKKLQAYMPASCCELTDGTGVNHCEHPPPPPVPLRRRLRWRVSSWWAGLRMRVGSWIAGVDLDREED